MTMSTRFLLAAIAGVIFGCGLVGCSLNMPGCQYGVVADSQQERCMTYAEYQRARGKEPRPPVDYKTEREKDQSSQNEAGQKGDKEADSRYRDWIP